MQAPGQLALTAVLLAVCTAPTGAFIHGKPEPSDNPRRSSSALGMMNQLWQAARERADAARQNQKQAEQTGSTYALTNADMFANMLDYAQDKLKNPPLQSTERNLVRLQQDVLLLAQELDRTRARLEAATRQRSVLTDTMQFVTGQSAPSGSAAEAPPPPVTDRLQSRRLVPVQGSKHTLIRDVTP